MIRLLYILLILSISACSQKEPSPALDVSLEGFKTVLIPGSNTQYLTRIDTFDRILEEGTLQDGKKHGQWITYHEDEKQIPASIYTYVNGKLNGTVTEYNTRGGLTSLKHYTNDVLNGRSVSYSNGRLVEVSNYLNGELHGKQTTYFERSDAIQKEVEFKEGKQHGIFRYYNEEGEVLMEYLYENGEKVSGGMVERPQEKESE